MLNPKVEPLMTANVAEVSEFLNIAVHTRPDLALNLLGMSMNNK
jgi:hypothetical protein